MNPAKAGLTAASIPPVLITVSPRRRIQPGRLAKMSRRIAGACNCRPLLLR